MSYGSLLPRFVIDTGYLKSLLGGKGTECELVESASVKSNKDNFVTLWSQRGSKSSTSGIESSADDFYSSTPVVVPTFLSECAVQVSRLFNFMEQHLSTVEHELGAFKRTTQPDIFARDAGLSVNNSNRQLVMSEDSGVEDNEEGERVKLITGAATKHDVESSVGVLNRLRRALISVQDSLNASFTALDDLVAQHDTQTQTKDGQEFLRTHSHTKQQYEHRLANCLEEVDSELNHHSQRGHTKIDGLGRVQEDKDSLLTSQARDSPVCCITVLVGLLLILALAVLSFMYWWDNKDPIWIVYLRFLRGPLFVVLCLYLFGINLKTWAVFGIDYITIFGYHPKGTPTPYYMFKVAGILTALFSGMIVVLLSVVPFTDSNTCKVIPLLMWAIVFILLFNPFKPLLRRARYSFIFVCVRILLAPFVFVRFGDFFLADQFNSTVAIFLDMEYLMCYVFTGPWTGVVDDTKCTASSNGIRPVISCLPALWRLLQCLRSFYDEKHPKHLVNAGKYFTTFPVVVAAALFSVRVHGTLDLAHLDLHEVGWIIILWFISSLVHAVYTFVWDIYCDWGLWDFSRGTFFRPKLIYQYRSIYVVAMILDLILRFAWTLKLTFAIVWSVNSDYIYTGLIFAEIARRFLWNFFRVEYAHILKTETATAD